MKIKLQIVIILSLSMVCLMLSQAVCLGATTNQISQFGITWTFDKEYECGQFANGDYWVVGPVTITDIDPAWDGEKHGSMVNPDSGNRDSWGEYVFQGWDSRAGVFDLSLVVAAPVVLSPNNSLVSVVSIEQVNRPQLKTAAVLTVMESAPPAGSFRPPYAGNNKPLYSTSGLRRDLLPNLALVPSTPNIQNIANGFERVWLDLGYYRDFEMYMCPSENMPNYGRDISTVIGDASLLLMLDEQELINQFGSNKDTLLIRFVQTGIDYYAVAENGGYWCAGGGVNSGRKWPILFAGLMLDHPGMKNIGIKSPTMSHEGFAEDGYTFYVTGHPNADSVWRFNGSYWVSDGTDEDYNIYVPNPDPSLDPNPENFNAEGYRRRVSSGFTFYGHGNGGKGMDWLEYTEEHRGLPEWGIEPTKGEYYNALDWLAHYRICCNACGWAGFVLAANIMNAKALWNNNALFDYQDRYMDIENIEQNSRQDSKFAEEMWDTYRADYGCVWTRYNPDDIYSNGYNPCEPSTIPLADAGPDQTIIDEDNDDKEQVALDGSASQDPDGEIVSFIWSEGGSQIATGVNPTVTLSIGTHLITLTVTDDGGLTDTDTVTIRVLKGDKEFGKLPTGCYNNVIKPLKGEKATIMGEIEKRGYVKISLYDTKGKKIRELADEERDAGPYKYYWEGKNDSGNVVGSGLYFVHIQAGDYKKTKKIVVVK